MPYERILPFGASPNNSLPIFNNDPVTMCVGVEPTQLFNHGGNTDAYGQNSPECQVLLAQRCANFWDGACETASRQNGSLYNRNVPVYSDGTSNIGIDTGDLMLRNTAMEKYRINIRTNPAGSNECKMVTTQFNPLNPASPYLTYYQGDCLGEYAVNPATIDFDPVMNKILDKPAMFLPLLYNIRNTMARNGTLQMLVGKRLGNFLGVQNQPILVERPVVVVPTYGAYSYPRYYGYRRGVERGIKPTPHGFGGIRPDRRGGHNRRRQ